MSELSLLQRVARVRRFVSDRGMKAFGGLLWQRFVGRHLPARFTQSAARELRRFCATDRNAPTYIIWSTLDWNYPFRQRPHHLAKALADKRRRVIYITPEHGADNIVTTKRLSPYLMVTPLAELALEAADKPVLMILSTDTRWSAPHIEAAAARGAIIYDYIDALDDSLSVSAITPQRRALHARLLADDTHVAVLSVADVLDQEVARARTRAHAVVTNGVDLAPFLAAKRERTGLRDDFAAVVARGRPIIGYYGSLAAWFDYPLLLALARARPDFDIVTIGPDLDGSSDALADRPPNLHVLKGMDYGHLPAHGIWFDVCLVPFVINDITNATSPLKIFEYMAMRSPIVSTPMPECRKYSSISIGEDHAHFIAQVGAALSLRGNAEHSALLLKEAKANAWSAKIDEIEALVRMVLPPPSRLAVR